MHYYIVRGGIRLDGEDAVKATTVRENVVSGAVQYQITRKNL